MSLLGFRAETHPQQGPKASIDDRETDPAFFGLLDGRYGFSLDVCATADNAKCSRFFSIEDDGLTQSWRDETVWCNPPFSSIRPWIEKAWREHDEASHIVMLLPANRTEQGWWQELVEPFRDRVGGVLETKCLAGRLRFIAKEARRVGMNERPPFGCVLLEWCNGETPPHLILSPETRRLA